MPRRMARRGGRRRPAVRRKYGGNRKVRRAPRVYNIKRLGEPILFGQTLTSPPAITPVQAGGGSVLYGATTTGSFGPTLQFGGAFAFKLGAVIDPGDLTSLFDRYMITGVKLTFLYQSNIADTAGPTTLPVMWYAQDFDDATVPATVDIVQVKQYAKCKVLNANRPFSLFIKPRITKQVNSDSLTPAGETSERATYIDMSYPNVPHYGLKFWIDSWTNVGPEQSPAVCLRIQPTYYLRLKDTQ